MRNAPTSLALVALASVLAVAGCQRADEPSPYTSAAKPGVGSEPAGSPALPNGANPGTEIDVTANRTATAPGLAGDDSAAAREATSPTGGTSGAAPMPSEPAAGVRKTPPVPTAPPVDSAVEPLPQAGAAPALPATAGVDGAVAGGAPTPTATAAGSGDGKAVFTAQNCAQCHSVSSAGITGKSKMGPDLAGVGSRHSAASLRAILQQTEQVDGRKHPKKFSGSDADLQALVDWLAAQK